MNRLDYLTVRFHYRGTFEWVRGEWIYAGGRSGYSTVRQSKISVDELKKNLSDHVSISEKVMEKTELCWFLTDHANKRWLANLTDKSSVMRMVKHVADVGEVDLYAKIPELPEIADSEEISDQHEERKEPTAEQQQEEIEQVVTEPVPKKGRMNWYLSAGKDAQASQSAQE